MRFNVISNLKNGAGLQRDYEQLRGWLLARGHQVQGVQFNAKPLMVPPADVNLFDEVVEPNVFKAAPVQWVMPHPEWWFTGWEQYKWDKVLAKTRDCERIFKAKGFPVQYLGWAAKDLFQAGITKERKFLHVSGKSKFKNTHAVIQGCQMAGVQLTVVGETHRVADHELRCLMNSHFCQVMPSAYEGFGHVLHESQSTGQILITTDAPPMNEVTPSFCIPSVSTTTHHSAPLHKVSAMDVARAVKHVMDLPPLEVLKLSQEARAQFEKDQKYFSLALDDLLQSSIPVKHPSQA